jgi:3-carboxy-cis,cis-muconate cycloisomerase
MTALLDPLFRTDAMREIFSDTRRLQGMLDFEAALARAQARTGVTPKTAAAVIASQCRAELFNVNALARVCALAGNPAIPMVKALTALVEKRNKQAAGFVHLGATSQDAMDTGLVLQLREALDLVDSDVARLCGALAKLAKKYRNTPMAGRTWLQQAVPVTFGLKMAGALDALQRHRLRLWEMRPRVLVLQFGGAAGTLASLGDKGPRVATALAKELKLGEGAVPWHAHRDRVAEVATTLGLLVGSLGKIAQDIALMTQTEVGEAFEPAEKGKGGSSTMPHKRNPVGCAVVLAAAIKVPALVSVMLSAMTQEHERGLGGWHAEWETLPEICMLTSGALAHLIAIMEGLEIDPVRMRANLDATHGLILAEAVSAALAPKLGRESAHGLLEETCKLSVKQRKPLLNILEQNAVVAKHLSKADLRRLLDPGNYLGASGTFVDRALAEGTRKRKKR